MAIINRIPRAPSSGGVVWDLSSNTILHYRMNDDLASTAVIDAGSGATNGTSSVNTSTLSATGKINEALDFTASSSHTVNTNQTLNGAFNSPFSVSVWIKPDDGQPTSDQLNGAGIPGDACQWGITSTGKIRHYYLADANDVYTVTDDVIFSDGATSWTHVVFTLDGTTVRVYVNAVEKTVTGSSMSGITMANYNCTRNYLLGAYDDNSTVGSYWDGGIDDFRVMDKVLTQDEIDGLYNSGNGTEYQESGLSATWSAYDATLREENANQVAYWKAEDTSEEINSHTLTNVGSTTFTAGKNNNAFTLNGSTQYLYASDDIDWSFGTGDFTISAWIKIDTGSATQRIVSQQNVGADGFIFRVESNDKIALYANGVAIVTSTGTVSTATWYHVLASRIGSTAYVYINAGTPDSASDSTNLGDISERLAIGAYDIGGGTGEFLDGQIDEVSIWKGYGATASFVSNLYNSGTGAFYTS